MRFVNNEKFECFQLKAFFLIIALLNKIKESICSFFCFSSIVVDPKMVTRKLLGLPDLIKAQAFCIYKLTKIVMVG